MLPSKRRPTIPGEILQSEFLAPMKISQEAFVNHLGGTWTQPKLSEVIRGKRRVTEAIALDFADAFGTSAEFWLNLQQACDLWDAMQKHEQIPKLPDLVA